jgi:hypothetical protein
MMGKKVDWRSPQTRRYIRIINVTVPLIIASICALYHKRENSI